MPIQINNVPRRVVYAASGTGPYNFTFEILTASDISVYRDNTLLTLTTNYTVTINANGTGYVTLTATPTGATQIAIVGNRTIQRLTDFVTGGDFFANTLNDELDQQTIFAQQNAEGLARALQAPVSDPASINMTLPAAATRASRYLGFDASGNPAALTGTGSYSVINLAADVTGVLPIANGGTGASSAATARTALGILPTTVGTIETTTSGTTKTITGIPSTAKRISIMFNAVGASTAADIYLRVGTSAGILTSGYRSFFVRTTTGPATQAGTSGSSISTGNITGFSTDHKLDGCITFLLFDPSTFTYSVSGVTGASYIPVGPTVCTASIAGLTPSLPSAMDRIEILITAGGTNFNAGSVNIIYD